MPIPADAASRVDLNSTGDPSSSRRPEVARSTPARIFIKVDLPGSVLSHQNVNRAGVDGEIDFVQRDRSREALGDLLRDQNDSITVSSRLVGPIESDSYPVAYKTIFTGVTRIGDLE